ncbi:hypothetical protein RP20_CCG018454 [Aedes albopictus]|nr:hypothetical protein RP20_CCG018454 [Aedes albopictus]
MGLCCGSGDRVIQHTADDVLDPSESQPLKYDPEFKGPLSKRSCTDIPCLLLFIAFLAGWGAVAYYALHHGDLDRLLVPTDSNGLKCGVDSEVQKEPYLVFFDITECAKYDVPLYGCKTPQVCVKECPTEDFTFVTNLCNANSLASIRSKLICDHTVQKDQLDCNDIQSLIDRGRCARYYLKSVPFAKRCISDLPETECPYIPPMVLPQYQLAPSPKDHSTRSGKQLSAEMRDCASQRRRGRQLLVDRVTKLQSYFARYVDNLLSHVTNDTNIHQEINSPKEVGYFHAINVLGFFWGICFVSAFGDMVLAFTFATWYWTFRKKELRFFVLTTGFLRTVRYHLGTLAFGSLIIAICKIIRACLEYVDHKLRKYDNGVVKAVLCVCKCCFWCLESFLKFLNTNAYIMCAIHGKNFCSSAKDAFSLLARNILRVIALDKVTGFLFFLSKLLIACGMAAVTYTFFDSGPTKPLHYPFIPAILVFVGTYVIASVFFSVYSVAVDTLFLCFLEDCERNDGTQEKPYYMSKSLMKILGKKQKFDTSR